jgi:hypothetical protein
MLIFTTEEFTEKLRDEMLWGQEEYWKEVASSFHQFPPDVDWKFYLNAQSKGMLKVICGRNKTGELMAVAFILIAKHPHYACICGSLPLLFIHPSNRNGWDGIHLIREAEKEAALAGAQLFLTHGGIHNKIDKLFEFLKYSDFGRYFVKVLPNSTNGIKPIYKEA